MTEESARPRGDSPTEQATGTTRPEPELPIDLIGKIIADTYIVDRRIGAGGMGVVYQAHHISTNARVAIKCIHPAAVADPSVIRRFLHETRAASKIQHDNVVAIIDSGKISDGPHYFVMEFLEGEDLSALVAREGRLAWRRVTHILAQIAAALAAAHKLGIVHRDIKPANCLRTKRLGDDDFIKVLDFGLARSLPDPHARDEPMTSTGVIMGTPGYIAPEIYRGFRADFRADIYALGVLAYRLLEDELPPFRITESALAKTPSNLKAAILRCLADDPAERYSTADLVHDELVRILDVSEEGPTIGANSNAGRRELPRLNSRRKNAIAFASISVATLAASIVLMSADLDVEGERVTPPDLKSAVHATLILEVTPPKAKVQIGDENEHMSASVFGRSGVEFRDVVGGSVRIMEGVEPGAHLITAWSDGYLPFARTVTVHNRQVKKVTVSLYAVKERLSVGASLPNAPAESVVRRLLPPDLRAGFSKVTALARTCRKVGALPGTVVDLQVLIGTDGKVIAAVAQNPYYGTTIGRCVVDAVKAARFPKVERQQRVEQQFTL